MKVLKVTIFSIAHLFTLFSYEINILHTGDLRSHFEMFNSKNYTCDPETDKQNELETKCYGGAARRAGFIKKFRRENNNVLLLDAGGQYMGTPWYYVYRGKMSRYFLDYMEYDAITLGTYDFDLGLAGLEPLLNGSNYKIVCSNIIKNSKSTEMINNTVNSITVLTKDNRIIGLIGYLTPLTKLMSFTDGLTIENEMSVLEPHIEALKRQGVNIIIALAHSGLEMDKKIASRFQDIDVIIGGKSLLYNNDNDDGDVVSGVYPLVYHHTDDRKTLVAHAGKSGKYIGVLKVEFDDAGIITNWNGNPVVMDDEVPVDRSAADYINSREPKIRSFGESVVGSAKVNFSIDNRICRINECLFGNMYTDAVLHYVQQIFKWSNLSLAFINSGMFKASFAEGDITYNDLLSAFPIPHKITVIMVKGSILKQVFEKSVFFFDLTLRHGKFLQVSGFKVKYDMIQENGKRVESLKTKKCHSCTVFPNIDMDKMYEVVTNTFMSRGGDGYFMLKGLKFRLIDVGDVDVVMRYLRDFSPIFKTIEGRITGMDSFPGWNETKKKDNEPSIAKRFKSTCLFILLFNFLILES